MKKVVFVDDDYQLLQLVSATLRDTYKVVGVQDADEFQEKFTALQPDLVILDVALKRLEPYAGFRLLEWLKTNHSHVSIICFSGFPNRDDMERAEALGADWCVRKPCSMSELKAVVGEVIQ